MKIVNTRYKFLMELRELLPRRCDGVEIGVLDGDFSSDILDVINPRTLVLIDPFITNDVKYYKSADSLTTAYSTEEQYGKVLVRFEEQIFNGQVIVDRRYSYHAVSTYANGSLDFVYLDGSHLYEDVKRDLKDWLPKLSEAGLITGHDYVKLGGFGVIQAVDEFCKEYNFEMILFNSQGGDFALKRK